MANGLEDHFLYLFGGQNHGSYRLLFLGGQLGGPNRGSFCLIGQNNGSYRLNKPKTMGAIAQNEPPEAKTMGAIAQNESPEAKTMGTIAPPMERGLQKPIRAKSNFASASFGMCLHSINQSSKR